jgi:hypothetical protein
MSLPPWVSGAPSKDLPLLDALGSRGQLLEAFRHESDPVARATALSALVALEVNERRSGSDSADLAKLLENCAADPREADKVREAALIGLPFVSMACARAAIPGLLDSSRLLRARAVDLLEAITFLEMASLGRPKDSLSEELRAALRSHVARLVEDPTTSPECRNRARALLEHHAH